MESKENIGASRWLMAGAVLSCVFQLLWFAPKCIHQIDFDGMTYTGIARHLAHGEFHAAINAFRSPLISWLIAALSLAGSNLLYAGKFVSIAGYLLCLALLYVFVMQLWHSRSVASLAVLLFTLGRGIAVEAECAVCPDFLFAALVLVYFMVLLRCCRRNNRSDWLLLGAIHALAFLAKAIALPWLGLCTAVAVLLSNKAGKSMVARLALAALIPSIAAAGWAGVLHSKYGVYTTGSPFKTNFLQWTLDAYSQRRETTYAFLRDTSGDLDEYMANDPMPPGSWAWTYHVTPSQALPKIVLAEEHNIPLALKEIAIVATPGVVLGFIFVLMILTRDRRTRPLEWRMAAVIAVAAGSMILAYCLLVFEGRYLFPLLPLVLTIAARFLIADEEMNHRTWRRISVALVILGVAVSLIYQASPFRQLTRDFQTSSYNAGALLRRHSTAPSIVSLGSGPFPEHGEGWESGYQAAYFGGGRLIGTARSLPSSGDMETLLSDLRKASPGVVLVWGRPADGVYADAVRIIGSQYAHDGIEKIEDPVLGEVGAALFTTR
jgi:hypothetical protein